MTTACLRSPSVVVSRALPARSHRAGVDAARVLAVYGVVWLHAVRSGTLEGSRAMGRFSLPFLVFAAVFFAFQGLRRQPDRSFRQYAQSRLARLYLPFLAWSGVYLAFKLVKAVLLPDQPNDFPGLSVFWVGSFYHLWFIPFILVVSLLAFLVAKGTAGRPALECCVGTAAAVEGVLLALTPTTAQGVLAGPHGALVAGALPAACWAVALAIVARRFGTRYFEHATATMAGVALAALGIAWTWHAGSAPLAENLAGLGFMIAALGKVPAGWVGLLARLGPLAYGIYFAHLLPIKFLEAVATRLQSPVCWQLDVAVFAGAVVLSTLIAWALSQWRGTRWLVV